MNVFENGRSIDLMSVLDNKEWRSHYQERLKIQYPTAIIVSIKLNIPGPIKSSPLLKDSYNFGLRDIKQCLKQFKIVYERFFIENTTGPEGFLAVLGDLKAVKLATISFEETSTIGRLFDIDIMAEQNEQQLSRRSLGYRARTCFICDKDAKTCIKQGVHTLESGYDAINKICTIYMKKQITISKQSQDQIVRAAMTALLYEVSLNPKPGLVDPVSNGAHSDMTVFTFIDSSLSLQQYFNEAYAISHDFSGDDLTVMFETLRQLGVRAEAKMCGATHGVNTHKGAIFSLGILISAIAYGTRIGGVTVNDLQKIITKMTVDLVQHDFKNLYKKKQKLTAGEQQYQQYRLPGIRGEAAAGFPIVMDMALPFLLKSVGSTSQRLLDTLMKIASSIVDTNLIKRAGSPDILTELKQWSATYFELGGSQTSAGITYLKKLDVEFVQRHLSIGGTADNLISTVFLARLVGGI